MLIKNASLTQAEMAIELKKYNLNKSQPRVARMLQSMGYTRKRLVLIPEDRNFEKNIGERKNFALNIDFVSDNNLVFLDETGVNLHQSRKYGYSGKNSKAVKIVKNSRGKNISCMVAIKKSGIVAFKILENSFDGDKFISFINEYLVPNFNANKNDILILDNCSFHKRKDVLKLFYENNIEVSFLPPYSPQLNPIEEYFSYFKSKLNSAEKIWKNNEELIFIIVELFCEFFWAV